MRTLKGVEVAVASEVAVVVNKRAAEDARWTHTRARTHTCARATTHMHTHARTYTHMHTHTCTLKGAELAEAASKRAVEEARLKEQADLAEAVAKAATAEKIR